MPQSNVSPLLHPGKEWHCVTRGRQLWLGADRCRNVKIIGENTECYFSKVGCQYWRPCLLNTWRSSPTSYFGHKHTEIFRTPGLGLKPPMNLSVIGRKRNEWKIDWRCIVSISDCWLTGKYEVVCVDTMRVCRYGGCWHWCGGYRGVCVHNIDTSHQHFLCPGPPSPTLGWVSPRCQSSAYNVLWWDTGQSTQHLN